jgi:hypothetical protein
MWLEASPTRLELAFASLGGTEVDRLTLGA